MSRTKENLAHEQHVKLVNMDWLYQELTRPDNPTQDMLAEQLSNKSERES